MASPKKKAAKKTAAKAEVEGQVQNEIPTEGAAALEGRTEADVNVKADVEADLEVNSGSDGLAEHSAETTTSAELGLDEKTGVAPEAESDAPPAQETTTETTAKGELGDDVTNPFDYNDNAEEKTPSTLTEEKQKEIFESNQGSRGIFGQTVDQINDIRERADGRLLARDNFALGGGPRLYACVECSILVAVAKDGEIPIHYASPFSREVCAGSETTIEYAKEDA